MVKVILGQNVSEQQKNLGKNTQEVGEGCVSIEGEMKMKRLCHNIQSQVLAFHLHVGAAFKHQDAGRNTTLHPVILSNPVGPNDDIASRCFKRIGWAEVRHTERPTLRKNAISISDELGVHTRGFTSIGHCLQPRPQTRVQLPSCLVALF